MQNVEKNWSFLDRHMSHNPLDKKDPNNIWKGKKNSVVLARWNSLKKEGSIDASIVEKKNLNTGLRDFPMVSLWVKCSLKLSEKTLVNMSAVKIVRVYGSKSSRRGS